MPGAFCRFYAAVLLLAGSFAAHAGAPPTISPVPNQTIAMNRTTAILKVRVGDAQTAASKLVLTAWSANPVLTPAGSIVLGGLGSARTVKIKPANNQAGPIDTITLVVTNDQGLSTSTSFNLNVTNAGNANTAPVISIIPNQVIARDTNTESLGFIVADNETAPSALTVRASTSNPGVVPLSGIILGGKGSARTVQVFPNSTMGTAKITLTVSDGELSKSTSFTVKVTGPNTAPTITTPENLIVPLGTLSSLVEFTIGDAEKSAASLTVVAKSSNGALLPPSGLVLGGSGANRTLTLKPLAGETGVSALTLTVSDGSLSTTAKFLFAVYDAAAPAHAFARPAGIFVLDGPGGTPHTRSDGTTISLRDGAIRNASYVDGYVLRVRWADIELTRGIYDFTIIDNIVARLPAGQKLSLILVPGGEPAYIAEAPGAMTWDDANAMPEVWRAVPWDSYLRQRRDAFLQALGSHPIPGGGTFAHWPQLLAINPNLPGGFTGVRDPVAMNLSDMPGYSRAAFLAAVQDELRSVARNFPSKFVQIGFWSVTDGENANYGGAVAWECIRQALLAEFNGGAEPRIGFFQENLAAGREAWNSDPLDGRPLASGIAAPLAESQAQTWTSFQALGSWIAPFDFGSIDKTLYGTVGDGLEYAYNTFGTQYFELYAADLDTAAVQPEVQRWHDFLAALQGGSQPAP